MVKQHPFSWQWRQRSGCGENTHQPPAVLHLHAICFRKRRTTIRSLYHSGSVSLAQIMLRAKMNNLTHWGRMTHICVSKVTSIVSDNGLSPGRRQAIIWNNAGILLIGPLGTNFTGILIEIHTFSFKKMHLKMSSGKWRPFCLGLNVIIKSIYR